jgi:hypothetical protein
MKNLKYAVAGLALLYNTGCEISPSLKHHQLNHEKAREVIESIDNCATGLEYVEQYAGIAKAIAEDADMSNDLWQKVSDYYHKAIESSNEIQRRASKGDPCPEALKSYNVVQGFRFNVFSQELDKGQTVNLLQYHPDEERLERLRISLEGEGKRQFGTTISPVSRPIKAALDGSHEISFDYNPRSRSTLQGVKEKVREAYQN